MVLQPLVILGAGGFGREVLDVVEAVNARALTYRVLGFLDDGRPDLALLGRRNAAFLGPFGRLPELDAAYVIGVAAPSVRRRVDGWASALDVEPATLVHPSATFGSEVQIGPGTVVCAHVSVTTNVRIGRHVHLNPSCNVGHDSALHDYVTILPGASISGNVVLEEGVSVGTNASVIQGLRLGSDAVVGAGAAVVRPVPAGATVVGVPAKPLAGRTAEGGALRPGPSSE